MKSKIVIFNFLDISCGSNIMIGLNDILNEPLKCKNLHYSCLKVVRFQLQVPLNQTPLNIQFNSIKNLRILLEALHIFTFACLK